MAWHLPVQCYWFAANTTLVGERANKNSLQPWSRSPDSLQQPRPRPRAAIKRAREATCSGRVGLNTEGTFLVKITCRLERKSLPLQYFPLQKWCAISKIQCHFRKRLVVFLFQRFCVLCFEICIPSLFSPSLLWSAIYKTKQALNL